MVRPDSRGSVGSVRVERRGPGCRPRSAAGGRRSSLDRNIVAAGLSACGWTCVLGVGREGWQRGHVVTRRVGGHVPIQGGYRGTHRAFRGCCAHYHRRYPAGVPAPSGSADSRVVSAANQHSWRPHRPRRRPADCYRESETVAARE